MNHAEFCQLAIKWLKRPVPNKGLGCQAVSEPRTGLFTDARTNII